ncbi:MAG: 2-hydroxy-acid oxidase, partial [Candidatus Kariarchaeum pelagius]
MKNDSLQNELKVLLGDRYSTSTSVRYNFGGGEDVFDPISPQAVVFPENNEEISTILKLCNESLTPVIPYGTG